MEWTLCDCGCVLLAPLLVPVEREGGGGWEWEVVMVGRAEEAAAEDWVTAENTEQQ